tara:strand:+ start:58 stop:696 length:639 start_codon:yes stop_codon:yes gene_type:complete
LKAYLYILVSFVFIGCSSSENEEINAIEDVINEYLLRNEFAVSRTYKINSQITSNEHSEDSIIVPIEKEKLISTDIINDYNVLISDSLFSLSQRKNISPSLFAGNYKGSKYSAKYQELIISSSFRTLDSKKIQPHSIILNSPYKLADNEKEHKTINKDAISIYCSRVCFDSDRKYGVVVLRHSMGINGTNYSGKETALLIIKDGESWTYIEI